MNTQWGDNGHWQPLSVNWPGTLYGAALSWCVDSNRDLDLKAVLNRDVFEDSAGMTGDAVIELAEISERTGVRPENASALFNVLVRKEDAGTGSVKGLTVERLDEAQQALAGVVERLGRHRMACLDHVTVEAELRHAANMLHHACALSQAQWQGEDGSLQGIGSASLTRLASSLKDIQAEHRRLWVIRNRPGGLSESVGHLTELLAMYEARLNL